MFDVLVAYIFLELSVLNLYDYIYLIFGLELTMLTFLITSQSHWDWKTLLGRHSDTNRVAANIFFCRKVVRVGLQPSCWCC